MVVVIVRYFLALATMYGRIEDAKKSKGKKQKENQFRILSNFFSITISYFIYETIPYCLIIHYIYIFCTFVVVVGGFLGPQIMFCVCVCVYEEIWRETVWHLFPRYFDIDIGND